MIMIRIGIKSVSIANQFEVHHYTNEDGYPAASVFSPVMVETVDGREFYLPMGEACPDWFDPETGEGEPGYGYQARYDAGEMFDRIEHSYTIDPEFWIEIQPRPSMEEVLGPYGLAWQEEQEDRAMWGAR
jgi:hypothetical protein